MDEELNLTGEDSWNDSPKAKKPFPGTLPPSSDKEFWGDAQTETVEKEELARRQQDVYDRMKSHVVSMQGNEIICSTCPYTHSIPNPGGIFSVENGKLILDKGK